MPSLPTPTPVESPYILQKDGMTILNTYVEGDEVPYQYKRAYTMSTFDTMNFSGGYLELRAKVPFRNEDWEYALKGTGTPNTW